MVVPRNLSSVEYSGSQTSDQRAAPPDRTTRERIDIRISASEEDELSDLEVLRQYLLNQPSWLASLFVHLVLFVVLALLVVPSHVRDRITLTINSLHDEDLGEELVIASPLELVAPEELEFPNVFEISVEDIDLATETDIDITQLVSIDQDAGSVGEEATEFSFVSSHGNGIETGIVGGDIEGRSSRRANATQRGATPQSEEAVDRALKWLAEHQDYRGSWTFDLHASRCRGTCRNSGSGGFAKNGATALGVLAFLGAGHTWKEGPHHDVVKSALDFLMKSQQRDGSFVEPEGTMYSHGLAALALCEAAAMARQDRHSSYHRAFETRLRGAAQKSIDFIERSQHQGGGWRYFPGQAGDTSIVGWQAMALQSGRMAKLRVADKTFTGISRFLDSVSSDAYGATYGYQTPAPRQATTAVGLLCRMYHGWNRNHAGIINGAEQLSRMGPSRNNVYYDYYATQVMHHYQGPLWEQWNRTLRDHLVQTQVKTGHEAGSWFFEGDFGSGIGGRHYVTCMATMTLEVYYRHMPIYSAKAIPSD